MKSIFKSKTFWINVLGVGATIIGVIPVGIPTIITGGAINIVLRVLTTGPVAILPRPTPPIE